MPRIVGLSPKGAFVVFNALLWLAVILGVWTHRSKPTDYWKTERACWDHWNTRPDATAFPDFERMQLDSLAQCLAYMKGLKQ